MAYSVKMSSGFNTVVDYDHWFDVIRFTSNDLDDSPVDMDEHELVCQLYPSEVDEFVTGLLIAAEILTGRSSVVLAGLRNQRRNKTGEAVNKVMAEAAARLEGEQ